MFRINARIDITVQHMLQLCVKLTNLDSPV